MCITNDKSCVFFFQASHYLTEYQCHCSRDTGYILLLSTILLHSNQNLSAMMHCKPGGKPTQGCPQMFCIARGMIVMAFQSSSSSCLDGRDILPC